MGTLDSPRYGEIGDEMAFYDAALHAVHNGIDRPFSMDGVYGHIPVMATAYQAGVMQVFGDGVWGWKMTGVVSLTIAAVGLYVLGWQLADSATGLIAVSLMLSSHYLFGFAHVGYAGNLDILPPIVWAPALTLLAIRHSPHWWPVTGLCCAWGLYMHLAGVMAVSVAVVAILAYSSERDWWRCWPAVVVGAIALAPAAVDWGIARDAWRQSVGGYDGGVVGHRGERIIWNIVYNTRAWVKNTHASHHVRGPLIDPITGALAFVGAWRAPALLLAWLAMAWFASAVLSPHPLIAVTRLYVMVPPLALLAALGMVRIGRWLPTGYRVRGAVVLCGVIAWLNLYIHTGDW